MKNQVQIYHHLGLGDHIICNGLVREVSKTHEKVYCFVKKHNIDSVSFMYRDEPKIELIGVEDDWEVASKLTRDSKLIKVGFENLKTRKHNFDASFYRQVGLDFNLRWNGFYVERDCGAERQLFNQLNPNSEPYAFVHDDPSRGLHVDLCTVGKDLKIIKPSDCFVKGRLKSQFEKYNLFHWMLILEHSTEIHCMDSSFKCLVESLSCLPNTKLFYHQYVRGRGPQAVSSTRKEWIIIKRPSLGFIVQDIYRKIKKKLYALGEPKACEASAS
jgi:hypothetical protein